MFDIVHFLRQQLTIIVSIMDHLNHSNIIIIENISLSQLKMFGSKAKYIKAKESSIQITDGSEKNFFYLLQICIPYICLSTNNHGWAAYISAR